MGRFDGPGYPVGQAGKEKKTVRLCDGKYEFDIDEMGCVVAARRNGVDWPAGLEQRYSKSFGAALSRILELEEAYAETAPNVEVAAMALERSRIVAWLRSGTARIAMLHSNGRLADAIERGEHLPQEENKGQVLWQAGDTHCPAGLPDGDQSCPYAGGACPVHK